jgi:hypothetical protein
VADQWELYEYDSLVDPNAFQAYSGTHYWWNHNPNDNHDMKDGIDNSLVSKSIDLTNAKDAHLAAYFKFNFNDDPGRPPDGFRVEISSDNGVTWRPVNLGVRSSWGMSGDWATDGKSPDGTQAYTGIQDDGTDSNLPVWVSADSLWRLNTDLSGWSGSVIKIRFRVVLNNETSHYESPTTFRGFAVDNVIIRGNTTLSGAPVPPQMDDFPGLMKDPTGEEDNGQFMTESKDGVGTHLSKTKCQDPGGILLDEVYLDEKNKW